MGVIDFETCTMSDVIVHSLATHPSLFRDTLITTAALHAQHSRGSNSKAAAKIAHDMSCDCRRMAADIDMDDFDVESLALSERVIAFNVACGLQLVPHHIRNEIAGRST